MATVNQLLNEKLKLYELDDLFKEVRKVQRSTFKEAVDFYIAERNKLEGEPYLRRGTLAATAVNRFEKRLTDAIGANVGYKSEIRKYMTNFDKMDKLNVQVHKKLNKIDIKGVIELATKQQRGLVGGTVEKVVGEIGRFPENMLGDELRQQFTKPVKKVLYQNIMQGKSQSAAKKALHKFIVGNKGEIGQLERWSGQIARDSLSQYDGAVNDMVRKEFDLNGFKYIGSLVKDSRPQCVRWKRMKEIPMSILPKELANPTNKGQIPGTTKDNFATYRGGYNCNHHAVATRIEEKKKGLETPVTETPFVGAKTVKEAEAFGKQFSKGKVSYNGLGIDSANIINRTLLKNKVGKKIEKFKEITTVRTGKFDAATNVAFRDLKLNAKYLKDEATYTKRLKDEEWAFKYLKDNVEKVTDKRTLGIIKKGAGTERELVANSIGDTVEHEIGHHIDFTTLLSKRQDFRSEIMERRGQFDKGISFRATTDGLEYFGESYLAWKKGIKIDPKLAEYYKSLFK